MMFDAVKNYLLAGSAIVAGILGALWKNAVAARAKDKRKAEEKAAEVKDKATQAIIDGEKRKEESRASNDSDMGNFGK